MCNKPEEASLPDYSTPEGFWSPPGRPPSDSVGDTSEMIYRNVGYALTVWGLVEEELATLFYRMATESKSRLPADPLMLTFGSIENLIPRLEVAKVIATTFFERHKATKQQRKPFNNLLGQIREGARIRNDIAHGIIKYYTISVTSDPDETRQVFKGSFLSAPFYMTGRNEYHGLRSPDDFWPPTSRNIYLASDIHSFALKFNDLRAQIYEYYIRLLSPSF